MASWEWKKCYKCSQEVYIDNLCQICGRDPWIIKDDRKKQLKKTKRKIKEFEKALEYYNQKKKYLINVIDNMKETYTREDVIKVIDEILQYPDQLIDAIENENTDIGAEELLELGEKIFKNN